MVYDENLQSAYIAVDKKVTVDANDKIDGTDDNQLERMNSNNVVQTP